MFKKHLNESGKNYTEHFIFAFIAGWLLIYAGITSIIHSLIPSLFPFTSQKIVQKLESKIKI
ncbi:DUF6356 family protein [Methylophilaceae bacterium]|jgi:hypothetical protein|nr:DUF6356 family protein [Methylophilaceae bacterium]|tara:strand:+ start:121 stop:306 length:186 start_codon:yes stop_codon:yes gene_type:complete